MTKNVRKIPKHVSRRLEVLDDRYVAAARLLVVSSEEIKAGTFAHLGITLSDAGLVLPDRVIPPAESGKYSDRNINGYEIKRDDLPLETRYNAVESPNWGDSYYGTHTVYLPYKAYPRDFVAPRNSAIKVSCPSREVGRDQYLITFEVEHVLDREADTFEADLLEALNLLQENLEACGVEKSGATFADYEQSLRVSWNILPPGSSDEAVQRLFQGREVTEIEEALVHDRFDFLMSFDPEKLIYGSSGLQRYFGALLRDDLVVFENTAYGNAIYVMFEDWQTLSQRSRTELLSGRHGDNFERIIHTGDWKSEVESIVEQKLAD